MVVGVSEKQIEKRTSCPNAISFYIFFLQKVLNWLHLVNSFSIQTNLAGKKGTTVKKIVKRKNFAFPNINNQLLRNSSSNRLLIFIYYPKFLTFLQISIMYLNDRRKQVLSSQDSTKINCKRCFSLFMSNVFRVLFGYMQCTMYRMYTIPRDPFFHLLRRIVVWCIDFARDSLPSNRIAVIKSNLLWCNGRNVYIASTQCQQHHRGCCLCMSEHGGQSAEQWHTDKQ